MKTLFFLAFVPILLGSPIPEAAVMLNTVVKNSPSGGSVYDEKSAETARPEAIPADKVSLGTARSPKQSKESRINNLREQQTAILDEATEFLKPRPEDYVGIDPNDNYVKGWPEIFGPEAKRRERILKARDYLTYITTAAKTDLSENRIIQNEDAVHDVALQKIDGKGNLELRKYNGLLDIDLKKTGNLADIEVLKVKMAAELELRKEELRLKYEMLTKKAALTKEIITAIKTDPDIQIDLSDDGVISVKKGKQEPSIMYAPAYAPKSGCAPVIPGTQVNPGVQAR